ncbi:cisplatin damage response ATP-dependent DNA ligase [Parasphingorhabdus halotolerans]|uniref:DNA ligase (ATP) n=1 Tax=Parasphingorhabdus halotolerans TaxID=2725558 RepID=A0A6H2DI02_9SPHN|nr:cisplatin damage response ATP-dependent DNA ligase [Parasphingorhabdus halotolerans]QJB68299.1 cisplatin damage response ATP-dependent DNA ligase [Parasphingorhabdus halotolerans]
MQAFSELLDRLIYTRSRNAKLRLISEYLKTAPDPDRGWVLAALTEQIDFPKVKISAVRNMAKDRIDETLFKLSRDFVGDTAETVALIWPETENFVPDNMLSVDNVVTQLSEVSRAQAPMLLANLMDQLDSNGRYALIKFATGAMRIGVSARLAKTAFALAYGIAVEEIEEVWHSLKPPYSELFAWGEGKAGKPDLKGVPFFRPFMLAHPLEERTVDLKDYVAEWKWDGIRIQIVGTGNETRLYSRGGDDITPAFPDVAQAFDAVGVVDGELLVRGDFQGGEAASFNALQQRLGRKKVSKKMLDDFPAFVRLYDILYDGEHDLRHLQWTKRRQSLETFVPKLDGSRFDISSILEADDFGHLAQIRDGARDAAIEGVMLKRRDSPYIAGRKTGLWYKWKRDPLVADCVMMYAQRGSGKRSSFYSDYTFGCWTDDPKNGGELYPVGKAYSGFTDEELKMLDRFVRQNTLNRFGPVREVEKTMVLEVAFDSIHESKRHKSGLAMRFPRISRIRTDKPADEADMVSTLKAMIT